MGTQVSPPPAGGGARMLNGMTGQGGWDPSWNASLPATSSALVTAVKCPYASHTSWTDTPGANEALPMNCVSWYEAFAFCIWDGGFLPTEAQWNYAAAAGSEQRVYPWSNPASSPTIDCAHANYFDGTVYCVNQTYGAVNRVGIESPSGDSKYGQADLAGNVWEWTLDWYQTPYANPCNDCADLSAATSRVFRGGSHREGALFLRGAYHGIYSARPPGYRDITIGVRCSRAP